jgi:hypothetical protein
MVYFSWFLEHQFWQSKIFHFLKIYFWLDHFSGRSSIDGWIRGNGRGKIMIPTSGEIGLPEWYDPSHSNCLSRFSDQDTDRILIFSSTTFDFYRLHRLSGGIIAYFVKAFEAPKDLLSVSESFGPPISLL